MMVSVPTSSLPILDGSVPVFSNNLNIKGSVHNLENLDKVTNKNIFTFKVIFVLFPYVF